MKNMLCCIALMSVAFGCKRDGPNSKSVPDSQDQPAQQDKHVADGNKPHRTEVDALPPGKPFTNSIGMKLVYIPPGEFMMGSRDSEAEVVRKWGVGKPEYFTQEHPQHRVKIASGFHMSSTETNQSQYEVIMNDNPSEFRGQNNPVDNVSWDDAVAFCRKLSAKEGRTYRLPTEAEWEYACRAGTTTPFYTGETIGTTQSNHNGDKKTMPVGSFSPNDFGLYDMHGNVSEWCQDWFDEDYYATSPTTNPQGPSTGIFRVLRGGNWQCTVTQCRSACRARCTPFMGLEYYGFRVLMEK